MDWMKMKGWRIRTGWHVGRSGWDDVSVSAVCASSPASSCALAFGPAPQAEDANKSSRKLVHAALTFHPCLARWLMVTDSNVNISAWWYFVVSVWWENTWLFLHLMKLTLEFRQLIITLSCQRERCAKCYLCRKSTAPNQNDKYDCSRESKLR